MAKAKKETAIEDEILSSVYINPLTDFGFKKLFLNKDLMIAFLWEKHGNSHPFATKKDVDRWRCVSDRPHKRTSQEIAEK